MTYYIYKGQIIYETWVNEAGHIFSIIRPPTKPIKERKEK